MNAAESSARTRLGKLFGKDKMGAAMVDWYDDGEGKLYALAVIELAAAPKKQAAPPDETMVDEPGPAPAVSDEITSIDGYFAKAAKAVAARRYDEAQDDLDLAALFLDSTDPRRIRYLALSGGIAIRTRDYPKAREDLREALELGPEAKERARIERALKSLEGR